MVKLVIGIGMMAVSLLLLIIVNLFSAIRIRKVRKEISGELKGE